MSKKPNFGKLGSASKQCRLEQGLSQAAFAEKVGVSLRTITRIEDGQSLGDLSRVKIEKYLALEGQPV